MKKSVVILLHTAYWIIYLLLITFIIFAVVFNRVDNKWLPASSSFFKTENMIFFLFFAFFNAAMGFYVFYYLLFPRYLKNKKIGPLIGFGFLSAFVIELFFSIIMSVVYPGPQMLAQSILKTVTAVLLMTAIMAIIPVIHGIMGLVMRGFIEWYGDIKIKEELNKRNYETELALVKAQMNPHFLFNTINNIDVLIEKDAAKASEYLNKLSDILRFMLYEAKGGKILLETELAYIEKYVDLQRIRSSNNNYISFEMKGQTNGHLIEPMLFIPFIENAFKHAENKKVENAVKVKFDIKINSIGFECENAFSLSEQAELERGGLGNEIIRRRLHLLYPGKHVLEIKKNEGIYKINLLLST